MPVMNVSSGCNCSKLHVLGAVDIWLLLYVEVGNNRIGECVFLLHISDNFFTSVLYYLKLCVRFIIGYICVAVLEINFDMR